MTAGTADLHDKDDDSRGRLFYTGRSRKTLRGFVCAHEELEGFAKILGEIFGFGKHR